MSGGLEAIKALVRKLTGRFVYHGLFPSTVQAQAADGTVDVLPDDEAVRGTGLSGIKIRHGVPGLKVFVTVGARVLLGFEQGDPSRPYVALWEEGDAVDHVEFGNDALEAARKGDAVEILLPPAVFSGTIGASPATGVLTFPAGKTSGTITAGSPRYKVGT